MRNRLTLMFGPELLWIAVYAVMHVLANRNKPPTELGSQSLEKWWLLLPMVLLPLTFGLLAARGNRWWMLARLNVAGLAGLCFSAYRITAAIDYQDTRNSGVPMGLVLSVCIGLFVLAMLDAAALPLLLWFNRKKKNTHAIPPPLV